MDNNSIIIVLSHANTEIKKHQLKECLLKLNGDILLSTNYPVDFETQKLCNWVLYDKKNEILPKELYHKYNVDFSYWYINNQGVKIIEDMEFDHGYAVYNLIKNGVKFAESLGKTKIHVLNYDYIIDMSEIIDNDKHLNDFDFVIYKYPEDTVKTMSSSIFSGKINNMIEFVSKYNNISEYYSLQGQITLETISYNLILNLTSNIYEKTYDELKEKYQIDMIKSVNFKGNYSPKDITNRFKEISIKYDCDKSIRHTYHEIYPNIFEKFLDKKINLFEIGIDQGKSLKVWKEFSTNCNVFGMDIGVEINNDDVKIIKGDQSNINDLYRVLSEIPKCDIIIDDGSHVPEHQLKTFYFLFEHLLKNGGVYVIEDVECSYWKPSETIYGYETGYLNIVDYFTKLNHQVNSKYNSISNDLNIHKITYASNCIIIEKNT
jgi:hypothetical protein